MTTTHGFQDPTPMECKAFTKFVNKKVQADNFTLYISQTD